MFYHNFVHKIVPEGLKRPEGAGRNKCNFGHKTQPLNLLGNGFKLAKIGSSHACARIKRLVITITPRRGGKGAGKPKADRATTKRK